MSPLPSHCWAEFSTADGVAIPRGTSLPMSRVWSSARGLGGAFGRDRGGFLVEHVPFNKAYDGSFREYFLGYN